MKKYKISLIALLCATIGFGAASNPKVYVILFGGQSNALGWGYPQYLEETGNRLASPQTDDVYVVVGNLAALESGTVFPLQSGAGKPALKPHMVYAAGAKAPINRFGPELSMARTVRDQIDIPGSKVAIIKYAYGGTSLYKDWLPDGTAETSGDGVYYQNFHTAVSNGLAALRAKFPSYDIELVGMGWVQGEADAGARKAATYRKNLTRFIADVRATYGADLPFVLSKLSLNQLNEGSNRRADWEAVRKAQQAVADADPLVSATETTGSVYSVYPRGVDAGTVHFDSSALLQIGKDLGAALMNLVDR